MNNFKLYLISSFVTCATAIVSVVDVSLNGWSRIYFIYLSVMSLGMILTEHFHKLWKEEKTMEEKK